MTAMQVADNLEEGIKRAIFSIKTVKISMADGGEGTLQSFINATGGKIILCEVTGLLGKKLKAEFGLLGEGEMSVIKMALTSGFPPVLEVKKPPWDSGPGELACLRLSFPGIVVPWKRGMFPEPGGIYFVKNLT